MQSDRQIVLVQPPELLEHEFGLGARVDEDQRGFVLVDGFHDLGQGVLRHVPGPGHAGLRGQDADLRPRPGPARDQPRRRTAADIAGQRLRLRHRRRETDAGRARRQRRQPCQTQRQQVAALDAGERVQLVDHHVTQMREELVRIPIGQHQRKLLGCGQQNVRRVVALALPPRLRRIAGAGLDADRQAHLRDRRFKVAADIDRKRLQRRQIERVQARLAVRRQLGQIQKARQKTGQRLTATGGRRQQHMLAGPRRRQHRELMRPRRPAASREPVVEGRQQQRWRLRCDDVHATLYNPFAVYPYVPRGRRSDIARSLNPACSPAAPC